MGWFSCYFVPNTPFECYADSSVTPLHTTNNFHSEKNPVYSLRKIILAITYLTIESNFFHTGISFMFVLCRNHHRTDCTRRWLSALWEKFSTHLTSLGQFLDLPYSIRVSLRLHGELCKNDTNTIIRKPLNKYGPRICIAWTYGSSRRTKVYLLHSFKM